MELVYIRAQLVDFDLLSYLAHVAGFKGIWGSGLSVSASLGVRDSNEASWTQVGFSPFARHDTMTH